MGSLFVTLFLFHLAFGAEDAENQLAEYLKESKGNEVLTTSYGTTVSVQDAEDGLSADKSLLMNQYLTESIMHLARERIPTRVVHTDGAGAKGYFEVTHDVSKITNVKLFNGVGKKTPILGRFATSVRDSGAGETFQGNRGSAFKFYTEEGNMDLTALLNSAFGVKNPADGPAFVHILKTNPRTNLFDPNMLWDFYVHHPEAIVAQLGSLSPRGRPNGYRNMVGYCIHTFQVENKDAQISFVRLNWVPVSGFKNLTIEEGDILNGIDPDYATKDLYNAIAKGDYPEYTLNMQVIPKKDLEKQKFDIFDTTLGWPLEQFPNVPIGKLVLNKNPDDYIQEIEMAAFNPGHLLPGIRGMDKLFEMRCMLYREASMHRLGVNFNNIKVNCPLNKVNTYSINGAAPNYEGRGSPNYYPNSFNGPNPEDILYQIPLHKVHVKPGPTEHHYEQAAQYYKHLGSDEKIMTINNAAISLRHVTPPLQEKALKLFEYVDKELPNKIRAAIKTNIGTLAYYMDKMKNENQTSNNSKIHKLGQVYVASNEKVIN